MIARRMTLALLALGVVGGYGSALESLARRHRARRDAFERHVARVCSDATRATMQQNPPR
jgi:hypothetical protein